MAVVITPESELGKEMSRWERPYVYSAFPKMLYMAHRRADGVVSVGEPNDDSFTRGCQRTVASEQEMQQALEEGWRKTPQEALERHEGKSKAIADAAAHRNYEDRNMSDAAKEEAEELDEEAGMEHVPEIPETPIRRGPGRPPKSKK